MKIMLRWLVFVVLMIPGPLFAQSWRVQHVDPYGQAESAIRVDCRNQEIHILCNYGGDDLFHYYSADNGMSWTKEFLSKTTFLPYEHNAIDALVDAYGNYHVVYFDADSNAIHACRAAATGWKKDTIKAGNEGYVLSRELYLDMLPSGQLAVFLINGDDLCYFERHNGGWVSSKMLNIDTAFTRGYGFDVDASGILHLVIAGGDGMLYHFFSVDNGLNWEKQLIGDFNADQHVVMKTDAAGVPHIVVPQMTYKNSSGAVIPVCSYITKDATGGWRSQVLEFFPGDDFSRLSLNDFDNHQPSITIDQNDGVHIVFVPVYCQVRDSNSCDTLVYAYREKDEADFEFSSIPCKDVFYPGVDISVENNDIYCAYIGSADGLTSRSGVELAVLHVEETTGALLLSPGQRANELQAEVQVENKRVKLEIYDHGEIDNDVLSISLNDELVLENYTLGSDRKEIVLRLKKDTTYYLSLVAVYEGDFPPCTAVVNVLDGTNESTITLVSDTVKNGTIKLVVK